MLVRLPFTMAQIRNNAKNKKEEQFMQAQGSGGFNLVSL